MRSIAVIGGDGVGPEVTGAGVRALVEFKYYLEHGGMRPGDELEILAEFDAVHERSDRGSGLGKPRLRG